MATAALPAEFAAPMAAAVFLLGTSMYFGTLVSGARRKYDVPYPTMYAPADHKHATIFNCYQRAHQNLVENSTGVLTTLVIGSLSGNPTLTIANAAGVALYIVSRYAYHAGYTTGDPKKRNNGDFGYAGLLPSYLITIYTIAKTALPGVLPF